MASFADIQYCIYADKVGGVQNGQKYADVIQGWSIVKDENHILTCGAFFMNLFGSKVGITISSEHFLFRNNSSGT